MIVAQLLISTQTVSDLLPGFGSAIQRLLGRDLTTHGSREVFIQDIPVLKGAGNPEVREEGVGKEGLILGLQVVLDICFSPASV